MDELCKLSFLGAELLLKDIPKGVIEGENTAIILSNNSSSFETDKKHQQSIQEEQNYFPSPAVFVYTLPNIAIGEIAIRHKIKGENTFYIFQKYDVDFMVAYVNALLTQNKATYCLTGWVEFNNQHYDCFLYLVGKYPTSTTHKHNSLFINKLYN